MRITRSLTLALAAASALSGCAVEDPTLEPGDTTSSHPRSGIAATGLQAGAAESYLSLPIGVPMAGYTGRLDLGNPIPDRRTSPYVTQFIPSAGVQTRIPVQVVWLQNNGQNVLFVKIDMCYAWDGLLFDMMNQISAATGIDVVDKVVFATNHSHASYGDHSNDVALYLGHDQYNPEVATRLVSEVVAVAQQALASMGPAALGVGFDPQFDPIGVDQIFRDRRGENDELIGVDGEVLGHGYKDERLTLIRVDASKGTTSTSDDEPIALIHSFGMHGTIMGGDNTLLSIEAPGYSGLKVQEMFSKQVVVMHLQGAGGDVSPAGSQSDFARMETIGNRAAPKIYDLWSATKTAIGDIPLELLTRSIHQDRDQMRIQRGGTTDYYYSPYTRVYRGDDKVFDDQGNILNPIDEFNTENGAALCSGDEGSLILGALFGWTPATHAYPYNTCANIDPILALMDAPMFNFDLGWVELPLETSLSTVISTMKLGPVPIYTAGEGQVTDNLVMGFFPGEPLSLYSDTFRKELEVTYGYDFKNTVTVGYAQDHEGYLLTLEDWLAGGYEPSINLWGPIQAEYVLEQAVKLAGQFGKNDPNVPESSVPHPQYVSPYPLEPAVPDVTADAGTVPGKVPSYVYTYKNGRVPTSPQPAAEVERATGVATFLWKGGDAIVDLPDVIIEREISAGNWQAVRHPSGRPFSNALGDILLTYTPDPLIDEGQQTHYWLASWQAVGDPIHSTAGLPAGNYRFKVTGRAKTTSGGAFPWPTTTYALASDAFSVVANTGLVLAPTWASGQLTVNASYPAAANGYRLISMSAADQKDLNPLNQGTLTQVQAQVAIYTDAGVEVWKNTAVVFSTQQGYSTATVSPSGLAAGTYKVVVTDIFGNLGQSTFTVS